MRKLSFLGIVLMITLSICLSGCNIKQSVAQARQDEGEDQILTGMVEADSFDVASKVPGRIEKIMVKRGQRVEKGEELVELKFDELDAKLNQATSAIEAAKAQLELAEQGPRKEEIEAAKEQVMAAKQQVQLAEKMFTRVENLSKQGVMPEAKYDEASFKFEVAKNQLSMAEAKLHALKKGARPQQIKALQALVAKGEAAAQEVNVYKRESVQRSPITGEVAEIILKEGEIAPTANPIVTVVDTDHPYFLFTAREDRLANVNKGDVVDVYVPGRDRTLKAKITDLSVMADFATWRPTPTQSQYELKSFEVRLVPLTSDVKLLPGMSAYWKLSGGNKGKSEKQKSRKDYGE